MNEPSLFDAEAYRVEIPPAPKLTPSQRLKARQAERIALGEHPLSWVGEVPRRIPLAPKGTGTCGTCDLKQRPHHRGRAYAKCAAGAFRLPDGAGFREVWPRAAHSEATDVRSWWPACTAYVSRETGRRSTLHGWEPRVGDLVWVQMYSPQHPEIDSTIEERIAHGKTYLERRLMIVTAVHPDHPRPGLTCWSTRKPGRDLGPAYWSGCDSDCCVLEEATEDETGEVT